MSAILLAPHHDDETLFAAFTILREKPKVIIVLESHLQRQRGNTKPHPSRYSSPILITNDVREQETTRAMGVLGLDPYDERDLEFWPFRDDKPDWDGVRSRIARLDTNAHIYAPCPYPAGGGHEHHNVIGQIAQTYVEPLRLTLYDTYVYGSSRITDGTPVEYEPGWVARKLEALACYESQIELWPHHFLAPQLEYYAT